VELPEPAEDSILLGARERPPVARLALGDPIDCSCYVLDRIANAAALDRAPRESASARFRILVECVPRCVLLCRRARLRSSASDSLEYEWALLCHLCAHAEWYGLGTSGVFVLLFVLSKLAELTDTVLLLLSEKPIIPLHWWHHATVLLYCWHSYVVQISTGVWFAVMNYVVHFIMYGYFAGMGTRFRKSFVRFAVYITFMQLIQMLVGMWVTIRAAMYQMEGKHCHVNRTNSVLGLAMYFSYFVLFGLLFVSNYLVKGKERHGIPKKERSVIRTVSRQMVQPPVDSGSLDELGELVEDKKLN